MEDPRQYPDPVRNQLRSRLRIRKKSFRIHNTLTGTKRKWSKNINITTTKERKLPAAGKRGRMHERGGDPCAIPAGSFPISTRGFIAGLTVNFPHPAQLWQTKFLKEYVQSSSHQPVIIQLSACQATRWYSLLPSLLWHESCKAAASQVAALCLSCRGLVPVKPRPSAYQAAA